MDLSFLRAIQSIKEQITYKDEEKLVKAVTNAYAEYDPIQLNYIFLRLQDCMREILKCRGQNKYKRPHMGKEALDRAGRLPVSLEIDKDLVDQSLHWLEHGSDDDSMTDWSEGDGDEEDEADSDAEL